MPADRWVFGRSDENPYCRVEQIVEDIQNRAEWSMARKVHAVVVRTFG